MQILIPDSWLREFLNTNATPKDIQRCLSLCGPSVERMHEKDGDYIYDIEVTTNRVDCMSVVGIAREAAAILPRFGFTAKLQNNPYDKHLTLKTKSTVGYLTVNIDSMLCPKFSAVLLSKIKVANSPDWLVKKLELVGLRSLNNVIDVSNYLTHELGQPVHTFDYDKISKHTMKLRTSLPGEQIVTLDNKVHELLGGDIVIEDGSGNLIDLSGIMGAKNSNVDDQTTNVLLFVQNYEPVHIRKTSMSQASRTTAAVLFEKGLPTESVLPTLSYGIQLLKQLAHATPNSDILDISAPESSDKILTLSSPLTKYTSTRLGVDITAQEIKSILKDLGFTMSSETKITIPWFRKLDIEIAEDIVEEIARLYGYHNLPTQLMSGAIPTQENTKEFYWLSKIKNMLKYWGYTESYTYSLTPTDSGLKLKNALSSEWMYLRTNLISSHRAIIAENRGRVTELNFFEIANVYLPNINDLPSEQLHLVISTTDPNISKLKGVVEALFGELGTHQSFQIQKIDNSLYIEINLDSILHQANSVKTFQPISKYAPIIEDLTIELSKPYPELEKQIKTTSPLIQNISLIDQYGSKITLQITYHSSDKQLSNEDIAPLRKKLTSL